MAHASSASDTDPTLWYGVTDPKARKRIQDRLAQRARRKRLSEAAKQSEKLSATSAASSATTKQKAARKKTKTTEKVSSCSKPAEGKSADQSQALVIWTEHPPSSSTAESTGMSTTSTCESDSKTLVRSCPKTEYIYLTCCANLQAIADHSATSLSAHSLPHKIDWIMAIEICGMVLGIAGCNLGFTKSSRQLNIPETLQPSPLQLSTAHDLWIDKLPFPRLRDNLILLSSCIDMEEFLQDSLQMQAFALDPGAMPWDPKKWRVKPEFRAKWGYLFN